MLAMYKFGACYDDGRGVIRDVNKSLVWYTKAAAQGDKDAQNELDRLNASNN